MAVFTEVTEMEVQYLLDQTGLGLLDSFEGILEGTQNTNYFVNCSRGRFVLTLFEHQSSDQVLFSLRLMQYLKRSGLPVPDPVPSLCSGAILHSLRGKSVSIVDRLPGDSVLLPTTRHCRLAGMSLAQLHLSAAGFGIWKANPHGLDWCVSAYRRVYRALTGEQQRLMESELSYQGNIASSSDFIRIPRGPIHADLFRDNALFMGEHEDVALTGIFDFYFSGYNALIFDIAVCLNDWCVNELCGCESEEKSSAFLSGYQAVRPLSGSEKHLLNAMLRAAALRFWISRTLDYYSPRKARLLNVRRANQFEYVLRRRIANPMTI